jgi:hypothetical protein
LKPRRSFSFAQAREKFCVHRSAGEEGGDLGSVQDMFGRPAKDELPDPRVAYAPITSQAAATSGLAALLARLTPKRS